MSFSAFARRASLPAVAAASAGVLSSRSDCEGIVDSIVRNAYYSKPSSIKLTYFNIEGVVEPTRCALKIAGIPFEDARIKFQEWNELKPTTPFGALPFIEIDGGEKIAQSDAILRYAGKLGGLYPLDPREALEVDEVVDFCVDVAQSLAPSVLVGMGRGDAAKLSPKQRAAKVKTMREDLCKPENLPKLLGCLEAKLAKTGTGYFVGSSPTIADCAVLGRVSRRLSSGILDHIPKAIVDDFPLLAAHKKRMESIPALAAHYAKK